MNELAWEGLIEILRGNQPSLKATARLWRRDDFFGADWGGQLELPVVFRRLIPAGDYELRLPSGAEASARIEAGPSTTSMTFPTLTGIGHPPFGGAQARPVAVELELELEDESTEDAPAAATPVAAGTRVPAAVPALAVSEALELPEVPAAPAPAASEAPESEVAAVPAPPARPSTLIQLRSDSDGAAVSGHVEPTEAIARAYLGAVEARQWLETVTRPGFEGRALEATRRQLDATTATLEGALRGRAGSDRWREVLAEHLAPLNWFAALAVTDAQSDVASAGRAVQSLVGVLEQLLAAEVASRSHARAA